MPDCILAFDTATGPCSVAVWKDGRMAAYLENIKPAVQSACLVPMIEQALQECGIGYADLDAVACTTGPGSFTGIRVGLATARGIALAANIPGLGFTTLEALSFAARKHAPKNATPILALLNAGKGEHYYQTFNIAPVWKPITETRLGVPDASGITHSVGNATAAGCIALPVSFPRANSLSELAATHADSASTLVPCYIRPPDAKPFVKTL